MSKTNKPSWILKLGSIMFLVLLILSVFYAVKKSKEISQKVDSRFTSYDNLFFHTNSVVVDSLGNIIGQVYIHTNNKEIDSFYNDSTRRKTQYYYNLKSGVLKIKEQLGK